MNVKRQVELDKVNIALRILHAVKNRIFSIRKLNALQQSSCCHVFTKANYTFNIIKFCVTSSDILSTSCFKTFTNITSLSPFSLSGSMPHNLLWILKRLFPVNIKAPWTMWFDLCMYLTANCVYNSVLWNYPDLITSLLSRSGQLNAHSLQIIILISLPPNCVWWEKLDGG